MEELLKLENIVKVYPNGVVANKHVNFSVRESEIHALVGENGTGKSTLMKILFGIEKPTEGKVILRGKEMHFDSPVQAISEGIGMVHQHFMLVPSLTVAENIVLGVEPTKGIFVDMDKAITQTEELLRKYNFDIDPRAVVEDVSVGIKQKIEILKALFRGAKILILDEPTAVLTPQETEELFRQLKFLKENGHTIIFISHKLNEVKELCDRVTVMRKGKSVGVFPIQEVSKEEISNLMVGKEFSWELKKSKADPKEVRLRVDRLHVKDLSGKSRLKDVSFALRSGEILGIVGVEGNGQKEIVEAVTGMTPFHSGSILIDGKNIGGHSIKQIRMLGVSHIPEDRMSRGVAATASIEENMFSTYLDDKRFFKGIFMDGKKIRAWAREKIEEFAIKTDSERTPVKMLSGGNIQKVVVAREFSNEPRIILADQPTRGIDIGAARLIHDRLIELRDKGTAVLLVSADLTELLDLSDSLIVLYNGEIVAYFEDSKEVTEQFLGKFMLGIERQEEDVIRRCMHE